MRLGSDFVEVLLLKKKEKMSLVVQASCYVVAFCDFFVMVWLKKTKTLFRKIYS